MLSCVATYFAIYLCKVRAFDCKDVAMCHLGDSEENLRLISFAAAAAALLRINSKGALASEARSKGPSAQKMIRVRPTLLARMHAVGSKKVMSHWETPCLWHRGGLTARFRSNVPPSLPPGSPRPSDRTAHHVLVRVCRLLLVVGL